MALSACAIMTDIQEALKSTAYQLHGLSHACSSCQWDAHVLAQRGVFSQTGVLMRHMNC